MNAYQQMIAKHTTENPAHVEAWMRVERDTLDALSPEEFRFAALFAARSVRFGGAKMSQDLADSMGIK